MNTLNAQPRTNWLKPWLFAAALAMLCPSLLQAQLTAADFTSPSTNSTEGATWYGRVTFAPFAYNNHSVTVMSGTHIVPQSNVSDTSDDSVGYIDITLAPLINQSGRVTVEVKAWSGNPNDADVLEFEVVFLPLPPPVQLDLTFSSPATNAAPGATFSGDLSFSPTNATMAFTAQVLSGASIVPQTNITFNANYGTGLVTVSMQPLINTSGMVSVRIVADDTFTTDQVEFDVEYRRYSPNISSISNMAIDEDTSTNIAFTVSYPDSTPASAATVTVSSSNTNLVDAAGMTLGGTNPNRTLTLTPRADINGTTTITITATDTEYTVTETFVLTVNPVPDPPTIEHATNQSTLDDVGAFTILPDIVIDDVDHNMPDPETLSVTVTIQNTDLGLFFNGTSTFTTSGYPEQVTAAVRALQIVPVRFRGVPGTTNNMPVRVQVQDSVHPAVEANMTVAIEVSNTDPAFGFTLDPGVVVEGQSTQPFKLNFLVDPDHGENLFTLVIDFPNPAHTNLAVVNPTNALMNNISGLQAEIQNLVFHAKPGMSTSTNNTIVPVRVTIFDGFGGSASETNNIAIKPVLTSPSISGVPQQIINIDDGSSGLPIFPTVFVSDPDEGGTQSVSASLSQSNPSLGAFSQANFLLQGQADLTAALRAVLYIPEPGILPVNDDADTIITLVVTDATGLRTTNNFVTVNVRSVNNAPHIDNVPSPENQPVLIPPSGDIRPFEQIVLSNDDPEDVLFTITLDHAAKGTFDDLGDFEMTSPGVYRMEGSVSGIMDSLTNLLFVVNESFPFLPDDPGGTTFTLSAQDFALLTTTKTLYIQIQDEPRNHLVVRAQNDGLPGSFNYALSQAGNNDVITFALPSYPAIIRMQGSSADVLTRSMTIKGPGANLLTISGDSNGDLMPNRQLFAVNASVVFEGVTLAHGTAAFGGAIKVLENGALTLRNSAVVDSFATSYGGAIDVEGGRLTLDGVFIGRNRLSPDTGQGGAGVAIYTDKEIRILNSTFSDNVQANPNGVGGGALVVENYTVPTSLNVFITHSTFSENVDARGRASAVLSVGENTYVRPRFSLFGDFSGRNLGVVDGGLFISLGGNIVDDSSQVAGQQAGEPGAVYLLDHVNDKTLIDPKLAPLNLAGDPTPFYALLPDSQARNLGLASTTSLDQRGVVRVGTPDAGAIEYNAFGRLVINEIQLDEDEMPFIELYVRRDSTPVDLAPYSLFIDGVKIHDFADGEIIGTNDVHPTAGTAASTLIHPGFGMVIAFTNSPFALASANNPTPVVGPSVSTNYSLPIRGILTIGVGGSQQPVARQSYLGVYLNPADGTNILNTAGNSIALAPQFRGFALIPHALILPGPFEGVDMSRDLSSNTSSMGADVSGTPFGQDNAEPIALADLFTVSEDDVKILDVLANDFDGDGNDRLIIVDVSEESEPGTGNAATTVSALGATVTIIPGDTPLRGETILYDPRTAPILQALPVGVEAFDTFYYEIIDIGSAPVEGYAEFAANETLVTATNHRLTNDTAVVISGSAVTNYNNTFNVTVITEDTFTIPVAFVSPDTAPRGIWETVEPRAPTSRSEASVSVRVIGVNDPPVAVLDVITNVTERSIVRIMTHPDLAGSSITFPVTDPVPVPDMLSQDLLSNDYDIDTDDSWENLRVVGVLGAVHPILGYTGTPGFAPVTVHAPAHGLATGNEVLIANYGGHNTYNGYHAVTVVDADHFRIPRFYVDNHADKGVWVILNDGNRYGAVTDVGATVSLIPRADPIEDHLLYDANTSSFLRGLAEGKLHTNRFWYAVADSHGAIGIGPIDVIVVGVNDPPVPLPDPDSLSVLNPILDDDTSLEDVLVGGLDLMYVLPPAAGTSGRTDLHVLDLSGTLPGTLVLNDFFTTDEDTALEITTIDLLANDSDVDRVDEIQVESVDTQSREGATLTLFSGVITYDPTAAPDLQALAREEMLIDTFNVVVSDGMTGGSVTSLVAVLVIGMNDTPIANPVFHVTNEDEIFVFDPRDNDIEIDINSVEPDDRLRIIAQNNVPNPGEALVTMSTTNVVHDAPVSHLLDQLADWQSFTNVFDYTITDNSFLFAVDDQFYVPAGTVNKVLDVLANDRDFTDSEGILTIIDAGPALHGGMVSIGGGGTHLVYSAPAEFVGEDYFRYTIQNDKGDINSAVVMVRSVVPSINGILHAANDHLVVAAGETVTMNVLANDGMLPQSTAGLTITGIIASSIPGQPILTNNTFVYTATNAPSQLTFTYEVSGGGTSTAQADVVVDIIERRGTLNVRDDAFSVLVGSIDNELDVLANDLLVTESKSHLRIQSLVALPSYGTATINQAGTRIRYTPNSNFIGVDELQYVATDLLGGTGTGTVRVAVGRIVAGNDFYTLEATNNLPITLDVLANDRILPNPRSGTLTIVSVEPSVPTAAIGTLTINGAGDALQFVSSGAQGQQAFTYVVEDASVPPRTATGIVTIDTVPSGTYANPNRYRVRGNGSDYVLGVLSNDVRYPFTGQSFSILSIGTGANAPNQGGSVQIVNNQLQYTPAEDFFGEESFTYTMSDGTATDVAQVTVTVLRGDLFANDDQYAVFYEIPAGDTQPRSFTLPVTLNDRILPALDQVVTITDLGAGTNAPSHGGTVTIAPNGLSLIYRPALEPAPSYVERFTYEISDGGSRRASGEVRVLVKNREDSLLNVTQDDAFTVARNSTNNALSVLVNDFVLPGTASGWSISEVSATQEGGIVAIDGSVIRYTPPANFVGVDAFTYNVSDGLGGTGSASVAVRVGALPTLPSLFTVLSDAMEEELDVLVNDALTPDYSEEYELYQLFGATEGGTVTISGQNTVLYTPNAGYAGPYPYTETFQYRVRDDSLIAFTGTVDVIVHQVGSDRSTSTITLLVEGRNDPPVIINETTPGHITDKQTITPFPGLTIIEIDEQYNEPVDVLVEIDDADKGSFTSLGAFEDLGGGQYALTNMNGAAATLALSQLVYVPVENRITVPTTEDVYFTVTVTDNKSPPVSDSNTVVSVTAVNDPPIITGTRSGQEIYYLYSADLFNTVTITEVDDLTIQPLTVTVSILQPTNGSLANLGSFVQTDPGVYAATNITAAAATAQLRTMTFSVAPNAVQPGNPLTTHFRVTVDDGFAPPVEDLNTDVTAYNAYEGMVRPDDVNLRPSFGVAVDVIDDFAVVGGHLASAAAGTASGTAIIYQRDTSHTNNWVEYRVLAPATVGAGDRFGRSVAMNNEWLAVGSISNAISSIRTGSVYLFQRDEGGTDNWGEWLRLAATNLTEASWFGLSVDLDGDLMAVGAPRADLHGTGGPVGAVFLFARNEGGPNAWGEVMRWAPNTVGSAGSEFGWSISLHGDTLIVGAPDYNVDTGSSTREGKVFQFVRDEGGPDNWGLVDMLSASNLANSRSFGWDVSLHENLLAVGAPLMNANENFITAHGRVHVYERPSATNAFDLVTTLNQTSDNARRFGYSVSVWRSRLFVGSPHNSAAPHVGASYLFQRAAPASSTWNLVEKFVRPAGSSAGLFGGAVAMKRQSAIIGAASDTSVPNNHGQAFLYRFLHNAPPVALQSIPDQFGEVDEYFEYTLPPDLFYDPDEEDDLAIRVEFPDGDNGLVFSDGVFSGMPVAIGVFQVNVIARDLSGGEAVISFSIVISDGTALTGSLRDQWNLLYFGGAVTDPSQESTLWGGSADPDDNGWSNDQEYAFGGNPQDGNPPDGVDMEPIGDDQMLISYVRRSNDPDIYFKLQATEDMFIWYDASHMILGQVTTAIDSETEHVVIQIQLPDNVPALAYRILATFL